MLTQNGGLYAYAGNNPVRYTDPDGRESGYFTDLDAAGGFGHSGMYAQNKKGQYVTFEIIGVGELSNNGIEISTEQGSLVKDKNNLETTVLSNITDNLFPSPPLAAKIKKPGQAACLMRTFNDRESMEAGLKKLGFDEIIDFKTTARQDATILKAALEQGSNFSSYQLLNNSCGSWARDILCTEGSGIKSQNPLVQVKGILPWTVPITIGANLLLANKHAKSKQF